MIDARRHVAPAMIAIFIFAPTAWWLMDREPPYIRESGEIVAALPSDCGLADDAPAGLFAGGCAAAEWKIRSLRACPSYDRFNVHRTLIDSKDARHVLPATSSIYGRTRPRQDLTRYFPIPEKMPTGATQYQSSACFACNPLQHLFFPICVDTPQLIFTVQEPPK